MGIMTFDEVYDEYQRQAARVRSIWDRNAAKRPYEPKEPLVYIDYPAIDAMLIRAAQDEFGFTPKEAGFIHGEAYERYHSSYGDMPYGMKRLCDFVQRFKRLS